MDAGDLPSVPLIPPPPPVEVGGGEEEVVLTSWAILILIALLLSTLFVSYFFERRRIRKIFMHETIVALGMGAFVGLIVRFGSGGKDFAEMVSFDHRYFFNLILPPIILNSGYDLKRKSFFKNFGTILSFAFVGTFIASIVMGILIYLVVLLHLTSVRLTFLDCMMFGAILSSTDPVTVVAIFQQLKVDPDLFAIVFGESVLNDSVAIVLFTTLSKYQDQEATLQSLLNGTLSFLTVFTGSLLIGILIALITALSLKHTHLHQHQSLESCIITLLAYSSYLLSNSIHLSGIVSLLFCAITLKHYAYDNMSLRTRRTTKYMFRVLSQLSENFVFIYLGVTLFANREQVFSFGLTLFTIVAVLVSRWCSVFPVARVLNRLNPAGGGKPLLPQNYQTILWWAGLRGAIAFALSFEMSSKNAPAMRTTTLIVCVMSVVGLGGTVGIALEETKVKTGVADEEDGESSEEEEDWDDEIALYGGEGAFRSRGRVEGAGGAGGIRSLSAGGAPAHSYNLRSKTRRGSLADEEEDEFLVTSPDGTSMESHWFIDFDEKWMKPLFTRRRVGTSKKRISRGQRPRDSPTRAGLLESGRLRSPQRPQFSQNAKDRNPENKGDTPNRQVSSSSEVRAASTTRRLSTGHTPAPGRSTTISPLGMSRNAQSSASGTWRGLAVNASDQGNESFMGMNGDREKRND
ncbi:monovalent cation:H+ antiporter, CPA1 (nhx1) [Rhizoclosmatium sp. JEL0117]|nr:monovalent cation:H+ antiporter, CPA1 (nhx1) [Rhizoclosmatium sp. JEL0117]